MPSNRIDAALTVAQREQAQAALASLTSSLPFLIDLGSGEKASMPKFGEKNRSFVIKALAIADAHPGDAAGQPEPGRVSRRRGPR